MSAEIRWFWKGFVPSTFDDWFRRRLSNFSPGGGKDRFDEYLLDLRQPELGLKKRGDQPGVEIKGLVGVLEGANCNSPFNGNVQIWCKWATDVLSLQGSPTVVLRKTRWVRKYDTSLGEPNEIKLNEHEKPEDSSVALPVEGCNVELTQIKLVDLGIGISDWWSFGFEAFGPMKLLSATLTRTVDLLVNPTPPVPREGNELSYPGWIKHTLSNSVR